MLMQLDIQPSTDLQAHDCSSTLNDMQLDAMRAFVKVAELASFTRAGEHLGLSKARISNLVRQLEGDLGTRLLSRSTRAVRLTADGERLITRAQKLVNDAQELQTLFQAPSNLTGSVRVDAPLGVAMLLIIPRLQEFLTAHPKIEVMVSSTDQRVDVVRAGFDCVVRMGELTPSRLIARKVCALEMINCVSPVYVQQHGIPTTIADLARHYVVHYSLAFGTDNPSFDYLDGKQIRCVPMRSRLTVNNSGAYLAACTAGFGIVQLPRYGVHERVRIGELVEVLPDYISAPMPVHIVHGYTRNVPKHVRAFMQWLTPLLQQHMG